jgi:hypothetical protein
VSKSKVLALSILGIVVPVVLALSAYLIARSTVGVAGTVPSLTHHPPETISPTVSPTEDDKDRSGPGSEESASPAPGMTATPTDDHSGRCSEPEHSSDPSCSSDSSGKGGGGDDDSSSNSGKGGGGDD